MNMSLYSQPRKRKILYPLAVMVAVCVLSFPGISLAINHPTSQPYETRPSPDGYLAYEIQPTPPMQIDNDVYVTMPDGVKLACNVYHPSKAGTFPVILAMTPYGKDLAPPTFNLDGSVNPNSYGPYIQRVYDHGSDLGHMKVSLLTTWEGPDPASWVPYDYVVIIADRRGGFKSGGLPPSSVKQADDIYWMIEWAVKQPWSDGKNVGMVGVSALAGNQYYTASHQPQSAYLKAIIPWESSTDGYRDSGFWGGIPETNFTKQALHASVQALPPDQHPTQAAEIWAAGIDPVANQSTLQSVPRLDLITIPTLLCASWSDKGLHTRGTFEAWRRISSTQKWLYTHGGSKWERFYSEDGLWYQKEFFDHYLKGVDNDWQRMPRVRLEVRETRDEYGVRLEKEFPLARTKYKKLYLDAQDGSLSAKPTNQGKVVYNSTGGGSASFDITFDRDTELTGYMKVKLWVSAKDADDMDLFVVVKKFASPCGDDSLLCATLEQVMGVDGIAKGNEIQFRGMNGHRHDMAARGQMRVSQRALDPVLSTDYQPVQLFQGEQKLTPGQIVPVEIALLPSSTMFRKGESLQLIIQGTAPVVDHPLMYYDWLINKGKHVIHTGGKYDSYLQIPVIPY